MAAEGIHSPYISLDLNVFAEQLYRLSAFEDLGADGTLALIAYEQDCTLRPPQIVLEVVSDPACLAHS